MIRGGWSHGRQYWLSVITPPNDILTCYYEVSSSGWVLVLCDKQIFCEAFVRVAVGLVVIVAMLIGCATEL